MKKSNKKLTLPHLLNAIKGLERGCCCEYDYKCGNCYLIQDIKDMAKEIKKNIDCNVISEKIVDNIILDLTDRSGLQNVWEGIDDSVQKEIRMSWEKIVSDIIKKHIID